MKLKYKIVLGLAGLSPVMASCDDATVSSVITAKGNNKLFVTDVANTTTRYVINCDSVPAGRFFYSALALGDTIVGRYVAAENRIYMSLAPDTTPILVLDCGKFNVGSAVYEAGARGTPDYIIDQMIQSRRPRLRKSRQR